MFIIFFSAAQAYLFRHQTENIFPSHPITEQSVSLLRQHVLTLAADS